MIEPIPRRFPPPAGKARRRPRTPLLATAVVLLGVWTVVFAYGLRGITEATPFDLPLASKLRVVDWLPQGWGFFTRSPRQPSRRIYRRVNGSWQSLLSPQMSLSSLFGIRRVSRRSSVEAAYLLDGVWDAWKVPCERSPFTCLEVYEAPEVFINRFPHPVVCGEIGVIEQDPVPYAWRTFEDLVMPSSVMRFRSDCP